MSTRLNFGSPLHVALWRHQEHIGTLFAKPNAKGALPMGLDKMPKPEKLRTCQTCMGNGTKDGKTCPTCKGKGTVKG
jgi:hypothetical protein